MRPSPTNIMNHLFRALAFSLFVALSVCGPSASCADGSADSRPATAFQPASTICNPLNLDYGPSAKFRHAADPVIVLFQDKYYLFSTGNRRGYHVSDDLRSWRLIAFDKQTVSDAGLAALADTGSFAPAATAHGEYIYYFETGNRQPNGPKTSPVLRTRDPQSGKWEKFVDLPADTYSDASLFFDDDGRVYMTFGMGGAEIAELDPVDFSEKKGTRRRLITMYPGNARIPYGIERGCREFETPRPPKDDTVDTSSFLYSFVSYPAREGSWLSKHAGRYYIQMGVPGTATAWYSDEMAESDSALGPYRQYDMPFSSKVGGFINSAGHSCVFKDRHGNWWQVTTMWIGMSEPYERRLGLFPVGFDAQGHMFSLTTMGDYPILVPDGPRDPRSLASGWMVLSYGRTCSASSSLADCPPNLASDENARTWWSAKTGDVGEWFQMDLGSACRINAIQANFAGQDAKDTRFIDPDDYHAYRVLASDDGVQWRLLIDKATQKACTPHDYVPLPEPITARYLKVENVYTASGGKFSIRDLRVFGQGTSKPPKSVDSLQVTRHIDDDRNATFTWKPVQGADGYQLRYGASEEALDHSVQIQGGASSQTTLHIFTRGVRYLFRLDAYNDSGITAGTVCESKGIDPDSLTKIWLSHTAETDPVSWRYTEQKPADDWYQPGFSDAAWQEAPAPFAGDGYASQTRWKSPDIWLRREFDVPAEEFTKAMLRIKHDDGAKVYVNGILIMSDDNNNGDYDEIPIRPEVVATLKPGKNVIAISCHQVMGGQVIDAGLFALVTK